MGIRNIVIIFFIGVLAILFARYVMVKYDFFTGSPVTCGFKTLGSYKLTTTKADLTATGAKGLIYISDLTKWDKITHTNANDSTYSYTDFTPTDLSSVDVKTRINNIMGCNSIPEFSSDVGVNTKTALILSLQSTTNPGSRVFFVKCFVPTANLSDSNVIVGEISGNTIATYSGTVKPVAVIQGALGTPNTTDTYTLSYTLCVAASRPEGFSYTNCCSNAFTSTAGVTSVAMTADDLKTPSQCAADKPPDTRDTSHNFDWSGTDKKDPNCKSGKYSLVTGGICTGSVDNDLYTKTTKDNDIKTSAQAADYLSSKNAISWSDWRSKYTYDDDKDSGDDDTSGSSSSSSNLSDADLAKLKELLSNKDTPNEYSWPQRYHNNRDKSGSLKPGLSDCQKYYNCKKYDAEDEDDYEGQCM